jgi:hypothetical protein
VECAGNTYSNSLAVVNVKLFICTPFHSACVVSVDVAGLLAY